MAVRKNPGSPYFGYRFQLGGRGYHGPTGCTSKREAEAVERAIRENAKAEAKQARRGVPGLTIDIAGARYYEEVGEHQANPQTVETDLARIASFLGKDTLLSDIGDEEVTRLVAWRRSQRAIAGGKEGKMFVSPATVNRSTVMRLQAVFTRAKHFWGMRFDGEPHWGQHKLKEPQERVRELKGDEGERIDAELRDDYAPYFAYVRQTGQRQRECLLRWSSVDWESRLITTTGKGGVTMYVPITDAVREILWPLRGDHPEFVFTYVCQRTRDGRVQGQRYPLTREGVKTHWTRLRRRAKVVGFRFHDFRHDLATKLLRETGNLKIVQRALNHRDIKTTTKYAHVNNDDLVSALDRVQQTGEKLAGKLAGRARLVG